MVASSSWFLGFVCFVLDHCFACQRTSHSFLLFVLVGASLHTWSAKACFRCLVLLIFVGASVSASKSWHFLLVGLRGGDEALLTRRTGSSLASIFGTAGFCYVFSRLHRVGVFLLLVFWCSHIGFGLFGTGCTMLLHFDQNASVSKRAHLIRHGLSNVMTLGVRISTGFLFSCGMV